MEVILNAFMGAFEFCFIPLWCTIFAINIVALGFATRELFRKSE